MLYTYIIYTYVYIESKILNQSLRPDFLELKTVENEMIPAVHLKNKRLDAKGTAKGREYFES